MLQSPQLPSDESLMTVLVNDIASIPHSFILVLDDYHIIHAPQIHGQLNFLIEHQPSNMHMAIITREDPPLSLSRLRARGQLTEVRQDDLRFSQQECADFLQLVMGLDLSVDDVTALERRTEGWIVGLQLAALSIRGHEDASGFIRAFTGSSRFILDYLMEEVFERQATDVKDFLLKTSILERLSAPLCDAVAGRTDSQLLLENLEQANLFIVSLDQSRTWYRYHQLFAELLRHRLRIHAKELEATLHICASDWFESNGYYPEAIQHALTATDWTRAKSLLARVTTEMLKRGEVATLIGWYSAFPNEVLMADPKLCFDYCWPLLLASQFDTAAPLLEHVKRLAQGIPEFLGEVLTAQAFLARGIGDNASMVEKSRQALELLSKNSLSSRGLVAINLGLAYWHMGKMEETEQVLAEARRASEATGNLYGVLTAMILHGRVLAVSGQLHQAKVVFEQAIERGGMIPINGLAHLDLAALYYEWNDLSESERHLDVAFALSQRGQNDEFLVSCWMMSLSLQLAQGNVERAQQSLIKARELVAKGKIPAQTADRVDVVAGRLVLAQDDPAAIHLLSDSLKDHVDMHSFYRFIGLTKAYLLLADGRKKEAGDFLNRLSQEASANGWQYGLIAVKVAQSLTVDRTELAQKILVEALGMAEAEGFIRVFLDAGAEIVLSLQELAKQRKHPAYVKRILESAGEKLDQTGTGAGSLVEPLSEREVEVLRLVTSGLSNREIASQLFISPGTAKTHIHNLCGKLGVRNRTEAAMRARELGIM
jgi:LuxR family maltose regulon positive regulatory protein